MKYIALLGSTGSIGVNVLAVVRQFPERYKVVALAAGTNVQRLAEQIREFQPELVSVCDESAGKGFSWIVAQGLPCKDCLWPGRK